MFGGIIRGLYYVLRWAQYEAMDVDARSVTSPVTHKVATKMLAGQGADHSPLRTKRKTVARPPNSSLLSMARVFKSYEWRVILDGFDKAFRFCFGQSPQLRQTYPTEPDFNAYIDSLSARDPRALYFERLVRQVQIQYQLSKITPARCQEQIDALEPFLTTLLQRESSHAIMHDLKAWLINLEVSEDEEVILMKATDLFNDLLMVLYPEDYLASVAQLKKEIKQIGTLFFNIAYNDPDPKQRTLAILYKLRDALREPAYRLARSDESDPIILLLHQLSIASLTNPEVAVCYELLGNAILEEEKVDEYAKATPLGILVEKLRNTAIKAGFPQDDEQPQTPIVETIGFAMNQITALIPVEQVVSNAWKFYKAKTEPTIKDYRGFYENNPGKLYEEIRGHVNNCVLITSSPAAGSDVAPEFSALLQSIENCNVMGISAPFQRIAYSNLQDKKGGKEEQQTKALMRLEDLYELSIKCITVYQGSYKNKNKDKPFTPKQKDLKLQELTADDNFMLAHQGKGSGYYFKPKDKERWTIISSKIVDLAYDYIVKGNQKATDAEKYIAFSELVNLGIIRHHEQIVAMTLPHNATMLSARSCGPACDRSVKVNMAMMSAMPRKAATERKAAAIGIGRSISAKGRVMTEERAITELGSLFKVVTSEKVRNFFDIIDMIDEKGNMPQQCKPTRRTLSFAKEAGE